MRNAEKNHTRNYIQPLGKKQGSRGTETNMRRQPGPDSS